MCKPGVHGSEVGARSALPEFGLRVPGQIYEPRPGAYAVVFNDQRRVAIVQTPSGYYLPGGGSEAGESPETTLQREGREECGDELRILRLLGEAVEYVLSEREGRGFAKQGTFFEAVFVGLSLNPSEMDHQVIWLSPAEAELTLTNRSHAWAVRRALTATSDA